MQCWSLVLVQPPTNNLKRYLDAYYVAGLQLLCSSSVSACVVLRCADCVTEIHPAVIQLQGVSTAYCNGAYKMLRKHCAGGEFISLYLCLKCLDD